MAQLLDAALFSCWFQVGFEAAAKKNIKPHAGCVIKVFTGIDYDMKPFVDVPSDDEVWKDISTACASGMPCFVGTHGSGNAATKALYDRLEKQKCLKLYSNHCYKLVACEERRGEKGEAVRYVIIKNPHNSSQKVLARRAVPRPEAPSSFPPPTHPTHSTLRRDPTLAPGPAIHRMGTVCELKSIKKDQFRDQFSCTLPELRQYFFAYELSKR